ncbi:MAG: type VI secretion protein IcmF/TssM N-terminal domain-containing protein, partial [Planctomyces sp.]
MTYYFYQAIEWGRWLVGLVPRSSIGPARYYLIIHYTFVAVLTLLLAYFTPELQGVVKLLGANTGLPDFVVRCWYGILFLVVYGLVRNVVWLLSLLGPEGCSDFPQLEADWREILSALERERLPVDELPLFFVNGLTPEQENNAFEAAFQSMEGSAWKVIAPPSASKAAVIRAYANDEAIYLCTPGVGSTSIQLGKLSRGGQGARVEAVGSSGEFSSVTGTMKAGALPFGNARGGPVSQAHLASSGTEQSTAPAMQSVASEAAPMGTMLPGSLQKVMQTVSQFSSNVVKGVGRQRLDPLSQLELLAGQRQLRYLCGLISRSRFPWIGLNGLLQAIPLSWASSADYARSLAPAIRHDIVEIHSAMHLQCPLVAMVTELDDVAGVRDFIIRGERMQPGLRKSRAGSSFPAGAEVSDRHAEWLVDAGLRWFRGWSYRAFAEDLDNSENTKLFQMVCELAERREGLTLLLREIFYRTLQPAVRLQGLYFSANGKANTEKGFIHGVLR